ncbi:MAG: hypothetical protein GY943_24165, partial [Chloroflexi bacterium]|nr:hypothetical protein [Chloroflexota bacterium]
MLVGLLGASEANGLALPDRTLGYIFIILAIFLLGFIIYKHQKPVRKAFFEQWKWLVTLSIAGFITAQLAPLQLPFSVQPLTPFSIVPLLLAATFLHPVSLIIIGLATGLGEAVSQTHQYLTIFNFAFVGYFAAHLMQQRYQGRPFQWLRHPVTVGVIGMIGAASLNGLAQFANTNATGNLAALDQALYSANNAFGMFIIEGIIGGILVLIILRGIPNLRPSPRLIPAPTHRSLRGRLLGNFLVFSAILTILVMALVFNLSISVSRQFVLDQMAHDATIAAAEIPEFQNELENLVETHDTAVYIEQNPTEHLEQLSKGTSAFRELIVVDERLNVIATYPPTNDTALNADEVDELQDNPDESTMETIGSEFSFIVPLKDSNNEPIGAIIGRAHPFALNKLIVSLQGTAEGGVGFIVNEMDEIIAHPIEDELTAEWIPNENGRFF